MEFLDRLTNPEKYVIIPSRNLGEKDVEYLKRVRAFQQGYNEGLKVNKIEALKYYVLNVEVRFIGRWMISLKRLRKYCYELL